MPFTARTFDDLHRQLVALGARPIHASRILGGWLAGGPLDAEPRRRAAPYPARVRAALPDLQADLDGMVVVLARHPSEDGSCRKLLRLRSGRTVESVDLPRDGLCVSTQVGCAVGCRFCKTGEFGLQAQLSALEILAQVVLARRERPVRGVVFMGMGEPSHNADAVLDAITALGTLGQLPHKALVFSTVGEPEILPRLLAQRVRPALALSLHTLDGTLRRDLLPGAPRVAPEELLASALAYADETTHPLLVQWTVLHGVNDSPEEARRLANVLQGRRAIVNYIPFNDVEGSGFQRPPIERCVDLVRTMKAGGVMSTLRMSAGQEVAGGCGQLRARHVAALT